MSERPDTVVSSTVRGSGKGQDTVVSANGHSPRSILNMDCSSLQRTRLEHLSSLGEGQFGEVELCRARGFGTEEGLVVVVKHITKSRNAGVQRAVNYEIEMYNRLHHANIAVMYRVFADVEPHLIVMEYTDWVYI